MFGYSLAAPPTPIVAELDPNWKPYLAAGLSQPWTYDFVANNGTNHGLLARYEHLHMSSPGDSGDVTHLGNLLAGTNAVRAGLDLPPITASIYINVQEFYAWRIRRIENVGDGTAYIYFDNMNATVGNATQNGDTTRIFGCEQPEWNFDSAGILSVQSGQHGYIANQGEWDAATTLPNKPPMPLLGGNPRGGIMWMRVTRGGGIPSGWPSVSQTRAVTPRRTPTNLQIEVVKEAARWGWFIPDWEDCQNPGDWAVWGFQYRTLDLNPTKWCPKNDFGERWMDWIGRFYNNVANSVHHIAASNAGVTHHFTDNTWVGPNSNIGDNNGWVDYMNLGSNQNTQANTPEIKALRLSYREGQYRFQQAFQRSMLEGGGHQTQWYANANVTSGSDSFPGNFPGDGYWGRMSKAMMEHINDGIDSAAGFASQLTKSRTMLKGFINKRKAVMHSHTFPSNTFDAASFLFTLAWYAMTFDDEREAGCVSLSGNDDALAYQIFMGAFPSYLDQVWGQPVEARPTAPGGGGNGTNSNGAGLWHREFDFVIMVANPTGGAQSFYPPIGLWKNQAGGGAIGVGGISVPSLSALMLIPA